MVYRIYNDKIVLMDDQELALAEVDFPPVDLENDDVVEITHTYVDETLRGQGVAGRLMEKLVENLRRTGQKAVPSCSYAVGWFQQHPEASDVLAETEQTEELGTEPVDAANTAESVDTANTAASVGRVESVDTANTVESVGIVNTMESVDKLNTTESVNTVNTAENAAQENLDPRGSGQKRILRAGTEVSQNSYGGNAAAGAAGERRTTSMAGRKAPGFPAADPVERYNGYSSPQDYSYKDPDAESFGTKFLRFIARVLQLFCGGLILMIMGVFGFSVVRKLEVLGSVGTMIGDRNIAETTYIGLSAAFLLLLFLEFFWVLSRKKFALGNRLASKDTGRGMTIFILVLLVYFVSFLTHFLFSQDSGNAAAGIRVFMDAVLLNGTILMALGAGGLVLSIFRKFIGR